MTPSSKKSDRKTFTTTINTDIQNGFKAKCATIGMPMNDILELFMKKFIDGEIFLNIALEEK